MNAPNPRPQPELDARAVERVRFAMMLLVATADAGSATGDPVHAPLWSELGQRTDAAEVAVAIADLAVAWVRRVEHATGHEFAGQLQQLAAALATVD
jgi:hypothetical protein